MVDPMIYKDRLYQQISRPLQQVYYSQISDAQNYISTKRCCIHDNCLVCKALDKEIEADRKRFEKEQAKKKSEYGKRCKAWIGLIHKLSEVKEK